MVEINTKEQNPPTAFIVTTPKLIVMPQCSFKFMLNASIPPVWIREAHKWGFAWLEKKGEEHFSPWEWAKMQRGEAHGQIVGDDGVPRWTLHVFETKMGEVLSAGWEYKDAPDFNPAKEFWDTLSHVGENVIICMQRDLYEQVADLHENKFVVEVRHCDKELATA